MKISTTRQFYVAPVAEEICLNIEKNILAGGSITDETGYFSNEDIDYEEI